MEMDERKCYERLGKRANTVSVTFSKHLLENKEQATEKEKLGAHLLVLYHFLYLLRRTEKINFANALTSIILEFYFSFHDTYSSLVEEVDEKYTDIHSFFLARYKVFCDDFEQTSKRGELLGGVSFYYFFTDPFFEEDFTNRDTIMKLINNNRPYRHKVNEILSRLLVTWNEATIPKMVLYSFEQKVD